MVNLASLYINEAWQVTQSNTYVLARALAANTPEQFTVPVDDVNVKAGFVIFGATNTTDDYYVREFTESQGADRVTNGGFDADTDWTKGAGWTIGAGVATAAGAISTALSQTAAGETPIIAGQSYLVTYTVTQSAGSVTPNVGGTAGTARSTSATFSEVIIAGATQLIEFTTSGFTGTLDDVSITACATVPGDATTGLASAMNVPGMALRQNTLYISVVSAGTPNVTASFYKG